MAKFNRTTLATFTSAALAASLGSISVAQADINPFAMTELHSGYMVADAGMPTESKCGANKAEEKVKDGQCGANKAEEKVKDGQCGANKAAPKVNDGQCGATKAEHKVKEVKCGEAKCGSNGKKV